jgi:flagellar motor protein MotB
MMQESDDLSLETRHVWPAISDLMACLFGLFVLLFVGQVTVQVALTEDLVREQAAHHAATERLESLERLLAGPLAHGLVTVSGGRIGIEGAVLFERSSAELSREGRALLTELAGPLRQYLGPRNLSLMISGFTDDLPITSQLNHVDNWELSAQRALTVTRALVTAGVPADSVFAAGFGSNHPVAPNDTEAHRALNRRVEITPVPRPSALAAGATTP